LISTLQIDKGHDNTRPDSFVVWLLLRLPHPTAGSIDMQTFVIDNV